MAGIRGNMKRGPATPFRNFYAGAMVKQQFHHLRLVLFRRQVQRGIGRGIFDINDKTPVKQE